MSELSYRVKEILSSVVLFTSPNETDNTTDCYLKYKDGSENWVPYNETEFFDTLSFCLDSPIDDDGIYVRQYKNRKGEIIKLEKACIINSKNFIDFLNYIEKTPEYLTEDIKETANLIRSLSIFPTMDAELKQKKGSIFDDEWPDLSAPIYTALKKELRADDKNKDELSIIYKTNNCGIVTYYEKPKIISRNFIMKFLKSQYQYPSY